MKTWWRSSMKTWLRQFHGFVRFGFGLGFLCVSVFLLGVLITPAIVSKNCDTNVAVPLYYHRICCPLGILNATTRLSVLTLHLLHHYCIVCFDW